AGAARSRRFPALRAPGDAARRSEARRPADGVPARGQARAGRLAEAAGRREPGGRRGRGQRPDAGADGPPRRTLPRAAAALGAKPRATAWCAQRAGPGAACAAGVTPGALVARRRPDRSLLIEGFLAGAFAARLGLRLLPDLHQLALAAQLEQPGCFEQRAQVAIAV